ncbi:hypothetical protein HAX54_049425 [Datura stramonium]|uniref:Uncharacterized protein n=1 Tax=Datura stramonium TaxID=4076 RepID=A0ABS8SVJ8_DATST|nr:hypothetical protein [Datura stramonium]
MAYFDDDDANTTNYLAKLENPNNHYTGIASLIAVVLVTNLCRGIDVLEIARIDENLWANQVVVITKIQNEMNPKLKKRKREPLVPHLSETMGNTTIDTSTQASDEALPSSSAPPVAP